MLEVKDLHVSLEGKEIIKGISLKVKQGEIHVIMGPNGSGKSTLAKSIMGHPKITVMKGDVLFNGKSILGLSTDKRAKMGLFLEFQNPVEIDGVGFINFLHTAKQSLSGGGVSTKELMTEIKEQHSGPEAQRGFHRQDPQSGLFRRREEEDRGAADVRA